MNDLVHIYFHIIGGIYWIRFLKVKALGQTISEHVVLQDSAKFHSRKVVPVRFSTSNACKCLFSHSFANRKCCQIY